MDAFQFCPKLVLNFFCFVFFRFFRFLFSFAGPDSGDAAGLEFRARSRQHGAADRSVSADLHTDAAPRRRGARCPSAAAEIGRQRRRRTSAPPAPPQPPASSQSPQSGRAATSGARHFTHLHFNFEMLNTFFEILIHFKI